MHAGGKWTDVSASVADERSQAVCHPVAEGRRDRRESHRQHAAEDGIYVVTWGALKTMIWEFYGRYNVETYAVLGSDWVGGDQVSPSGFDLTSLGRDLSLVEGSSSQ
jgi:hypothetical protein